MNNEIVVIVIQVKDLPIAPPKQKYSVAHGEDGGCMFCDRPTPDNLCDCAGAEEHNRRQNPSQGTPARPWDS